MITTNKSTSANRENARLTKAGDPKKTPKAIMSESSVEKEIAELLSVIEKKDAVIEKLKNELLILRRKLFGHSSERYIKEDPDQLKLDFGGVEKLPEEVQGKPTVNHILSS